MQTLPNMPQRTSEELRGREGERERECVLNSDAANHQRCVENNFFFQPAQGSELRPDERQARLEVGAKLGSGGCSSRWDKLDQRSEVDGWADPSVGWFGACQKVRGGNEWTGMEARGVEEGEEGGRG